MKTERHTSTGLLLCCATMLLASCQGVQPGHVNVLHIRSLSTYNRFDENVRVRLVKVVRESERRAHIFLDGLPQSGHEDHQTLEVSLTLESSDRPLQAGVYALNDHADLRCVVTIRTRRGTVAIGPSQNNLVEIERMDERSMSGKFLLNNGMTRIDGFFAATLP